MKRELITEINVNCPCILHSVIINYKEIIKYTVSLFYRAILHIQEESFMQASILLVEDDPEIGRIVRDMFVRENYHITWATTGLEGWGDFQEMAYDLVLVDLMLPEMDGFTLCKNIRLKSDVPMIMISARKEDESKIKGLHLGADDYVAKPFSLAELKARVESHLRRWRRYQGVPEVKNISTYMYGLTIDWDQRQVMLADENISLTSLEFKLLEVLAKHPERIFSKKELFEQEI